MHTVHGLLCFVVLGVDPYPPGLLLYQWGSHKYQWNNPEEYGWMEHRNHLRNDDLTTAKQSKMKICIYSCDTLYLLSSIRSWGDSILDKVYDFALSVTWWRHQMETFSALLAIYAGNSPVPVNSLHKGQWCGALMFSLITAWMNGWVNTREAGD